MSGNVWRFNKGEWTEAYVFLKLLGNGRIYGASDDLRQNPDVWIDIVSILRHERDGILLFEREGERISASLDGTGFKVICCDELNEKAAYLYGIIKGAPSGNGIFSNPAMQEYLEGLHFSQPKIPPLPDDAAKRYGSKTDIIITGENPSDSSRITEGFSIKSHMGQASTLFNCSSTSGFVYRINGCTVRDMHAANFTDSETGVIGYIRDSQTLSLEYAGCRNPVFSDNLAYIDLRMHEVLQTAVLVQTGYLIAAPSRSLKDIAETVAQINPISEVRHPERWYPAKFREFLFDAFAGMTASTPWGGQKRLTGGYIDVGASGEILYYRAVSDESFMSYLYEHTFMDRPSRGVYKDLAKINAASFFAGRTPSDAELASLRRSGGAMKSKKGDWGYVYENDGEFFIVLNFQIRFK